MKNDSNQKNYSNLYKNSSFIQDIDRNVLAVRTKLKDIVFDNSKKVLDIACGVSTLSKNFSSQAYGLDINKQSIVFAKKNEIKVKFGDIEKKWSYANNSFDIVIASQIIEHLVDTDHLLRESKRVLRKNGLLIIITPNLASWFNRLLLLLGYQPFFTEVSTIDKTLGLTFTRKLTKVRKPLGHLRLFTLGALKDLVELHGFHLYQAKGLEFVFFPRYLLFLDKFFSYIPTLASNIIVVGIKK